MLFCFAILAEENTQMKETVARTNSQLAEKENQLAKTKESLTEATNQLTASRNEVKTLTTQLTTANQKIANQEKTRDEIKVKVTLSRTVND